ncbi:MAG: ATP synthase gamma chain [Syntrophus sp. PtaU1.Bin005]|mgnify:CR=1 FL=1|jgi:F-type H+-transporting ATPase subunit gamma|uniref:ATP synthase F1 subunit gamma n=1 Tax=Syntrophus TaxID=43773 RepID=UPI0009C480D6|nr:MAG: ATP synthase gamma chain [Syntrophus sp. PtaB.Bin138]OPY82837.1 MAG: ATP synthase gamma chain [Syntrophus sp. PtaU1.Bin005]
MAALKDIKRKVAAVQKTKQITRAMNMVAASKFRAAQARMESFRPYAMKFMEVLDSLALRVNPEAHPLLAAREPKKIRVLCMSSDRGLCGGFNTNLIKSSERFVKEKMAAGLSVELTPVGRKSRDYFRRKYPIINEKTDILGKFDINLAVEISDDVITPFVNEEFDELYIIYNEFRNVSMQRPVVVRLLPLPSVGQEGEMDPDKTIDYVYEPSEEVLIEKLLSMYLHVLIFRALLETSAGENGARMAAMDNATRNCDEMIRTLTLQYNKVRQSAITAELMDIVGGTEALAKG